MDNKLEIAGKKLDSRLFIGTGKFSDNAVMQKAIEKSGSDLVTVALKRVQLNDPDDEKLKCIQQTNVRLLPNTSGVRTAKEAITAAKLAREALGTNWIKLEVHPDPRYLLPDPVETLKAAEELVKEDFVVLPYVHADPVLCKRLEEVGTATVMPLGAPIGSNKGLKTKAMLEIIIEESHVPVVVDAGLGAPSHAANAMEMGADAVLVNTAIAVAEDPGKMAHAFKSGVEAGRKGYEARLAASQDKAEATSPMTSFLQEEANREQK